jgi:DDE superfamily endonuclease
MEALAKRYPTGRVYVVWDNLNIHHGERWKKFNRRHRGRFRFVHTPLHASWVNQVEIWFSILQRRVLKHGSFVSAAELTARVLGFVRHWNRHEAHPFRWTFRGRRWSVGQRAACRLDPWRALSRSASPSRNRSAARLHRLTQSPPS